VDVSFRPVKKQKKRGKSERLTSREYEPDVGWLKLKLNWHRELGIRLQTNCTGAIGLGSQRVDHYGGILIESNVDGEEFKRA